MGILNFLCLEMIVFNHFEAHFLTEYLSCIHLYVSVLFRAILNLKIKYLFGKEDGHGVSKFE